MKQALDRLGSLRRLVNPAPPASSCVYYANSLNGRRPRKFFGRKCKADINSQLQIAIQP